MALGRMSSMEKGRPRTDSPRSQQPASRTVKSGRPRKKEGVAKRPDATGEL